MLFAETITLSGTYSTGGVTVKASKAKAVNAVYSTTVPGGYLAVPVSVSGGDSFVVKIFEVPASSALSSAAPMAELASGASLPANLSVIYDGF